MQIVQLINQSTALSAESLNLIVPALQEQVNRDFAPLWGVSANITIGTDPWPAQPDTYAIYLKDRCDISTDLGYHLDSTGTPTAQVGCQDALDDGQTISSVISHELLEMLADPSAQRMQGSYIVEVCDPVEQDTYTIGNIAVSNFVTPRYFGLSQVGQFDQLNYLSAGVPTLRPGGYMMHWNGTSWISTFGRLADGTLSWRVNHAGRTLLRARTSLSEINKQYLDP